MVSEAPSVNIREYQIRDHASVYKLTCTNLNQFRVYTQTLTKLVPVLIRALIFGIVRQNIGLFSALIISTCYECFLFAYTFIFCGWTYMRYNVKPQMSDPDLASFMANPPNNFFVATLSPSDLVVGTIGLIQVDEQSMLISRLGISPEARRMGLASKLVDHARAHAQAQGFQLLRAITRTINEPAMLLYPRLGVTLKGIHMVDNKILPGMQFAHGIRQADFEMDTCILK